MDSVISPAVRNCLGTHSRKGKRTLMKDVGVAVLLSNGNENVKTGMNREDVGQRCLFTA